MVGRNVSEGGVVGRGDCGLVIGGVVGRLQKHNVGYDSSSFGYKLTTSRTESPGAMVLFQTMVTTQLIFSNLYTSM